MRVGRRVPGGEKGGALAWARPRARGGRGGEREGEER